MISAPVPAPDVDCGADGLVGTEPPVSVPPFVTDRAVMAPDEAVTPSTTPFASVTVSPVTNPLPPFAPPPDTFADTTFSDALPAACTPPAACGAEIARFGTDVKPVPGVTVAPLTPCVMLSKISGWKPGSASVTL